MVIYFSITKTIGFVVFRFSFEMYHQSLLLSVGCGADVPYSPKDLVKPVGGVIPKVDRFAELRKANSVHSDTESIHSEKSSQIFRTVSYCTYVAQCTTMSTNFCLHSRNSPKPSDAIRSLRSRKTTTTNTSITRL